MNINWKVRFRNKTWLVLFIAAVLTFLYEVLALFGVTPAVSETAVLDTVMLFVRVLVLLGVVVDPTTGGVSDSQTAMTYETPKQ